TFFHFWRRFLWRPETQPELRHAARISLQNFEFIARDRGLDDFPPGRHMTGEIGDEPAERRHFLRRVLLAKVDADLLEGLVEIGLGVEQEVPAGKRLDERTFAHVVLVLDVADD